MLASLPCIMLPFSDLILQWPGAEAARTSLRFLFIGRPESNSFLSLGIHSFRVFMQAVESRYQPQGQCINQRGERAPLAGGQASLPPPTCSKQISTCHLATRGSPCKLQPPPQESRVCPAPVRSNESLMALLMKMKTQDMPNRD